MNGTQRWATAIVGWRQYKVHVGSADWQHRKPTGSLPAPHPVDYNSTKGWDGPNPPLLASLNVIGFTSTELLSWRTKIRLARKVGNGGEPIGQFCTLDLPDGLFGWSIHLSAPLRGRGGQSESPLERNRPSLLSNAPRHLLCIACFTFGRDQAIMYYLPRRLCFPLLVTLTRAIIIVAVVRDQRVVELTWTGEVISCLPHPPTRPTRDTRCNSSSPPGTRHKCKGHIHVVRVALLQPTVFSHFLAIYILVDKSHFNNIVLLRLGCNFRISLNTYLVIQSDIREVFSQICSAEVKLSLDVSPWTSIELSRVTSERSFLRYVLLKLGCLWTCPLGHPLNYPDVTSYFFRWIVTEIYLCGVVELQLSGLCGMLIMSARHLGALLHNISVHDGYFAIPVPLLNTAAVINIALSPHSMRTGNGQHSEGGYWRLKDVTTLTCQRFPCIWPILDV
ncbi:hypothetical protein J6590_056481 [Homalodisca vitripennis]|nr:hypothetical protein J6590_056481 [Homalodisca vitripennis]